jgi:hypothetical protein
MPEEILDWYIDCDAETFAKCKNDVKLAYIVTLSRSVNASTSSLVHFQVQSLYPLQRAFSEPQFIRRRFRKMTQSQSAKITWPIWKLEDAS